MSLPSSVRFHDGSVPSAVFAFDGFEGPAGLKRAYEFLGWDEKECDAVLIPRDIKLLQASSPTNPCPVHQDSHERSQRSALLVVACHRAGGLNALPPFPSYGHFAFLLRMLYFLEASVHILRVSLPDPAFIHSPTGYVQGLQLNFDGEVFDRLEDEHAAHAQTRRLLPQARSDSKEARRSEGEATAAAKKVGREAKDLKKEVKSLKSSVEALVVEREEGWRAERAAQKELEVLRTQRERDEKRWKGDIKTARAETDRLRRPPFRSSASAMLPFTTSSSSDVDNKDLVIRRLAQQVQSLNEQLRARNEEIVRLLSRGID